MKAKLLFMMFVMFIYVSNLFPLAVFSSLIEEDGHKGRYRQKLEEIINTMSGKDFDIQRLSEEQKLHFERFRDVTVKMAAQTVVNSKILVFDVDDTLSEDARMTPVSDDLLDIFISFLLNGKSVYLVTAAYEGIAFRSILDPLVQRILKSNNSELLLNCLFNNFVLYALQGAARYVFDSNKKRFSLDKEYSKKYVLQDKLDIQFNKAITDAIKEIWTDYELTVNPITSETEDLKNEARNGLSQIQITFKGDHPPLRDKTKEIEILCKEIEFFFKNEEKPDAKVSLWDDKTLAICRSDKQSAVKRIMEDISRRDDTSLSEVAEEVIAFGDRCYTQIPEGGDTGFVLGKDGVKHKFVDLGLGDQNMLQLLCQKNSPKCLWERQDLNLEDIKKRGFFPSIASDETSTPAHKITLNILKQACDKLNSAS
ncbi:hypothetical protein AB834_06855 [PVC group bacterium (ex Bugula neritina AB1)]|nr:hypothetical protein AB834_06855 [PVC group bacterium (ex Bugula neritina AB1)]